MDDNPPKRGVVWGPSDISGTAEVSRQILYSGRIGLQ